MFGASPTTRHFAQIIELGDVWMPIEGRFEIEESWQRLQAEAEAAGRDPSTLRLGVFGAKPDAAHLAHLAEIGASWVALVLPSLDRDAALATMDDYGKLLAELG